MPDNTDADGTPNDGVVVLKFPQYSFLQYRPLNGGPELPPVWNYSAKIAPTEIQIGQANYGEASVCKKADKKYMPQLGEYVLFTVDPKMKISAYVQVDQQMLDLIKKHKQ